MPKVDKSPSEQSLLKSICALDTIGKVLERVIYDRLHTVDECQESLQRVVTEHSKKNWWKHKLITAIKVYLERSILIPVSFSQSIKNIHHLQRTKLDTSRNYWNSDGVSESTESYFSTIGGLRNKEKTQAKLQANCVSRNLISKVGGFRCNQFFIRSAQRKLRKVEEVRKAPYLTSAGLDRTLIVVGSRQHASTPPLLLARLLHWDSGFHCMS